MVRTLTRPLPAFAAYAVALIGWHLPAPYNAALEIHGWHVVEHLALLVTATLGWWPILSPSTLAPSLPYAAQLLYLFVFGMPMTVVAAMVTAAEPVLYPFYEAAPRITDLTAARRSAAGRRDHVGAVRADPAHRLHDRSSSAGPPPRPRRPI